MTAVERRSLGDGERDRRCHTNDAHIHRCSRGRGRTPTQMPDAHRDFSPGHRLLGTPSHSVLHPHTHQAGLCVRDGSRTNPHIDNRRPMKRSRATTLPDATGSRCSDVACGVADGVSHPLSLSLCVFVCVLCGGLRAWTRPNCTTTERETTLRALSPPVAALCGTTRPPWFHSWLHWLIFARCPPHTWTYVHVRSSRPSARSLTPTVKVGPDEEQRELRKFRQQGGEKVEERLRFYGCNGDLWYFLGDEIS